MDKEYLFNRVTTANGPQLVAILLEELIDSLKKAAKSTELKDEEEAKAYIAKGKDILAELMSTLEGTSEIAVNLRSLYLFVNRLMTEGINKKSSVKFDEAIKVLGPLLEGWQQLGEDVSKTASPQQQRTKVTGLTYGKNQLNEYILDDDNKWKKG